MCYAQCQHEQQQQLAGCIVLIDAYWRDHMRGVSTRVLPCSEGGEGGGGVPVYASECVDIETSYQKATQLYAIYYS